MSEQREQRIDFDGLRRKVFDVNRRLLDDTYEAYTKKEVGRKSELVDRWRESFRTVTDPDAQQDGSDGMVLTGIVMTPIMRGEVGADFAEWVFNNARAHKLARSVQNICKATGVIPSAYNRREMEKVVEAYRKMRPKGAKSGSFSDRLAAIVLDHDDADFVRDWIDQTGEFEYRERRESDVSGALRTVTSRQNKSTNVSSSVESPFERAYNLGVQMEKAVSTKQYGRAAEIQAELDALEPAIREDVYYYELESELDEAVAEKDYAKAAAIQQKLDQLKAKSEADGVKPDAEDQARAAAIAYLEEKLEQSVAAKQYGEAATIQAELNQLKAEVEAEGKPKAEAEERANRIVNLERELEEAVATKTYGRAAEIQQEIDALKGDAVRPVPTTTHIPVHAQTTTPITVVVSQPPPSNGDLGKQRAELETRISSYGGFRVKEAKAVLLDSLGRAKTADDVAAVCARFEDYIR